MCILDENIIWDYKALFDHYSELEVQLSNFH